MKLLCLLLCFILIVFWGSMSIAAATPICEMKDGGIAFNGTGLINGNGYFPGESTTGRLTCFPEQSGIGKYYAGSSVSEFEIEKESWKTGNQNQHDSLEAEQEVKNPAPATLFLLGTGLIGLAAFRRKRPDRHSNFNP